MLWELVELALAQSQRVLEINVGLGRRNRMLASLLQLLKYKNKRKPKAMMEGFEIRQ
jgi:hypothetical protein